MKIAPSILGCSYLNLGEQVLSAIKGGAEWIHVDVMDGKFVPNISIGIPIVESLSKIDCFQDVHLMIDSPGKYIQKFIDAGADAVSFHYEATKNIDHNLNLISSNSCLAGLAINPDTKISVLYPYLNKVDYIVVMSVFPGFGGQKFIGSTPDKISQLSLYRKENDLKFEIQVDGGVTHKNAKMVHHAGADILVSGSGVFNDNYSPVDSILRIREECL